MMATFDMSVDSPSKQDRIERHLMRQRGAGVRTLAATFGFSFGFGEKKTSEPTNVAKALAGVPADSLQLPVVESAKAPKLSDSEDLKEVKVAVAKSYASKTYAKRHFEEYVEDSPTASSVPGDDDPNPPRPSSRPKKRKRIVKADQIVEALDHEPSVLALKGRPKRKAATRAVARVTAGFAEGAVPVDTLRRKQDASADFSQVITGPLLKPSEIQNKTGLATNSPQPPKKASQRQKFDGTASAINVDAAGHNDMRTSKVSAKTTDEQKRPRKAKRQAIAVPREELRQTDENASHVRERRPLSEADVNTSMYPSSPDKQNDKGDSLEKGPKMPPEAPRVRRKAASPIVLIPVAGRTSKSVTKLDDQQAVANDSSNIGGITERLYVRTDEDIPKKTNRIMTSEPAGPQKTASRLSGHRHKTKRAPELLKPRSKARSHQVKDVVPEVAKSLTNPGDHAGRLLQDDSQCLEENQGLESGLPSGRRVKRSNPVPRLDVDVWDDGKANHSVPSRKAHSQSTARNKKHQDVKSMGNGSERQNAEASATKTKPQPKATSAPRTRARVILEGMPQMSLDELLSNISSFAKSNELLPSKPKR